MRCSRLLSGAGALPPTNWCARNGAQKPHGEDFDDWWRRTLQDGVIVDTAAAKICRRSRRLPQIAPASDGGGFILTLAPDPRCSTAASPTMPGCRNAPSHSASRSGAMRFTSPERRAQLGLVDGDVVRLTAGTARPRGAGLRAARPGHRTIAGHARLRPHGGRQHGQRYRLRRVSGAASGFAVGDRRCQLAPNRERQNILRTQHFFTLEGEATSCSRGSISPICASPISASANPAPIRRRFTRRNVTTPTNGRW